MLATHKEKPSIFAMFYAPWCNHCKESKPIFEESALQHKDTTKYIRVDCEAQRKLCYEYQIDGYPTFYYFSNDNIRFLNCLINEKLNLLFYSLTIMIV